MRLRVSLRQLQRSSTCQTLPFWHDSSRSGSEVDAATIARFPKFADATRDVMENGDETSEGKNDERRRHVR